MGKNEIWLDFVIQDIKDTPVEKITTFLGVEPTFVQLKGEVRNAKVAQLNPSRTPQLWPVTRWWLSASADKSVSFEEQMAMLLDIIEPRVDLFKEVCNKYDCELVLALYIYVDNDESTPWVHLDKRHLRILNELELELDVDIIHLAES